MLRTPVETLPDGSALHDADGLDILSVIVELRCVKKDQNRVIGCGEAISCGLEMPRRKVSFGDAVVGEKTVCRLSVGPVLANQRNALPGAIGELLEEFSKSFV